MRWCGVQALAHVCHLTGKAAAKLQQAVLGSREASAACLWRWQQDQERVQLPAALPWLALQTSLQAGGGAAMDGQLDSPVSCKALPRLLTPWQMAPCTALRLHLHVRPESRARLCRSCSALQRVACHAAARLTWRLHAAVPPSGPWADLGGILLPVKPRTGHSPCSEAPQAFIQTPGAKHALQAAALALSQQRPLLLEGPPGTVLQLADGAQCWSVVVVRWGGQNDKGLDSTPWQEHMMPSSAAGIALDLPVQLTLEGGFVNALGYTASSHVLMSWSCLQDVARLPL